MTQIRAEINADGCLVINKETRRELKNHILSRVAVEFERVCPQTMQIGDFITTTYTATITYPVMFEEPTADGYGYLFFVER